jgi:phosphatidylglycerophosphatase A
VLVYWAAAAAGGWPATLAALAAAIVAGLWSAGAAETHFGYQDPGSIVIDEVAGQILALLFFAPTPRVLIVGFVLFRVMDVVKPFPANRLEALHGGFGIMADDLVAAVYANLVLWLIAWLAPEWLGIR